MAESEDSEKSDKSGKRKQRGNGKSRISASLGGTPFTGQPAYTVIEFNVAYFQGDEYQSFEADLRRECLAREVVIQRIERVMGIWRDELEPASAVTLYGREADIIEIAKRLGSQYKQQGMMVIVPDPAANQFVYTIHEIGPEEVAQAISAMQMFGVDGGRYMAGSLEIADKDDTWYEAVIAVSARLGKRLTQITARITLLEGAAPGEGESKDFQWVGPR